jgi:Sulfotransferase family
MLSVSKPGLKLERFVRGIVKKMPPWIVYHNLRWHFAGRKLLANWTDRRLLADQHHWLFILGLNNSGTTLVHDLLKSHPAMRWLPNEGQYLTSALPLPRTYGVPRNFSRRMDIFHWTEVDDPAPALRIKYDWAPYYQPRPGILLEKTPPNILRSRWLQQNFQPSRFLGIIRHPYAVCEGIRRREGHSIEEAALHWVRSNECLLNDGTLLRHFLCFRYEDLCLEPAEHLRKIEAFLDLDVAFDLTGLAKPRHIHNIDAKPQFIHNFNERSLQQLSAADTAIIDQIAGPLMERVGYESLRRMQVA